MPFHPKIEFALNRIGILGAMAAEEANIVFEENFEDLIKLSVDSISDPRKFKQALKRERRQEIEKRRQQSEKTQDLISLSLQDMDRQHRHDNNNTNDDASDDDDEENHHQKTDDEDEDDENTRIERESRRIRTELKQMSLALLDSLRMSIDIIRKKPSDSNNNGEEKEEEEPEIKISNVLLLRLVLCLLSDSSLANALRIPLLQEDFPLLARAILSCLAASSPKANKENNGGNTTAVVDAELAQHWNHLTFLVLDAIATMCADSAACRISFACCVPQIASILKSFITVVAAAPSSTNANKAAVVQKKPISFVRVTDNNNNNSCNDNNSTTTAASSNTNNINAADHPSSLSQPPKTTQDDVIFAGTACLETMLFHCPESVESLVLDSDGIFVLVSLYRQISVAAEAAKSSRERKDNKGGESQQQQLSNPTDTVAFIKRTLVHIRSCGAILEEDWKSKIFEPSSAQRIFGQQGDNIAVDELKWMLKSSTSVKKRTA